MQPAGPRFGTAEAATWECSAAHHVPCCGWAAPLPLPAPEGCGAARNRPPGQTAPTTVTPPCHAGCPSAHTCTLVLRGGSEQFLDEADRSLHDAIMIVRRTLKSPLVVPGGGAIDMELSKHLRCVCPASLAAYNNTGVPGWLVPGCCQ